MSVWHLPANTPALLTTFGVGLSERGRRSLCESFEETRGGSERYTEPSKNPTAGKGERERERATGEVKRGRPPETRLAYEKSQIAAGR